MTSAGSIGPKVMAHRGGRHGGPANSIDAIAHACDVGADSMELDVNETSDGVLLSTHDAVVKGMGWLTDQTFDGLLATDRDAWENRRLEDVVGYALSRGVSVYLDLKSITPTGLKHVVSTWPDEVEDRQIILASARGDVVSWIGENLPSAAASFLYYDPLLDLRSLASYQSPVYVHPCFDHMPDPFRFMNAEYVARARSLGFDLVSWSENHPERIAHLAELGFDFICTDEPELARSVAGPNE